MSEVSPWLIPLLAFVGATGSLLVCGVFYAFSTFVMKALSRLPNPQGLAAMQSINVTVLNSWFLAVFMGMAPVSAVACVVALLAWEANGSLALLLGGILYLAGCFGVTIVCNVPRNERLAAISPDDVKADPAWGRYLVEWSRWNHVRTAASLAAGVCFLVAVAIA